MDADCDTVGPIVYTSGRGATARPPGDALVIASWNVHVGGGDVQLFVQRLRSGDLTNGQRVTHFVLLLQEVFRAGPGLPLVAPGARVPARIGARTPSGARDGVLATAHALGLTAFYVPSMRNGPANGGDAEDRGNAILSTAPLDALTAIELPYERQRRVALAATVSGVDTAGRAWHLRVASAQLNAGSSTRRLWLLSSTVREEQARWLAEFFRTEPEPMVVGADLNTWAGGTRESAYTVLRREFPQTPDSARARFVGDLSLDFMFFRLPTSWSIEAGAMRDRYGSDHRPIVSTVRVGG